MLTPNSNLRFVFMFVARELLVMGGDSAKDQLRVLSEGVCTYWCKCM